MSLQAILADDHPLILKGLCQLLQDQAGVKVVGLALNGRQAVELVRDLDPDLLFLDILMPELNGLAALQQIQKLDCRTRVLVLTGLVSARLAGEALRCGARAYISKGSTTEDILAAIRAVMAGKRHLSPPISGMTSPEVFERSAADRRIGNALSGREQEVLQLVAEGKSSKQAAACLHVTAKTIEWHRKSVMDKLGLRSVAELTKYAVREGITPP